jgi:cytochrome c peroxidase
MTLRATLLAVVSAAAVLAGLSACGGGSVRTAAVPTYEWRMPAWVPPPTVPDDNPMTEAKFQLGRHLFYDKRLSADHTMSCASCHEQERAFTDDRALPTGVSGETVPRNSQGLANVAWLPVLTWANPNLKKLELQALIPMFGTHPAELGMAGRENELFERLRNEPRYRKLFADAFPCQRRSDSRPSWRSKSRPVGMNDAPAWQGARSGPLPCRRRARPACYVEVISPVSGSIATSGSAAGSATLAPRRRPADCASR